MNLTPLQVYKRYMAIKLHFTTNDYDVFKYNGKVKINQETFERRRDKYTIAKLAKKYDEKDIVNFLVANFVSGDRWGGMFDEESEATFLEWKKRIESLSYNFERDLRYLNSECEDRNKEFLYIFEIEKYKHPIILQALWGRYIEIESVIILNDLHSFIDDFDKVLYNDVLWPDFSRICKKYKPFLKYNKEKMQNVFSRYERQAEAA